MTQGRTRTLDLAQCFLDNRNLLRRKDLEMEGTAGHGVDDDVDVWLLLARRAATAGARHARVVRRNVLAGICRFRPAAP